MGGRRVTLVTSNWTKFMRRNKCIANSLSLLKSNFFSEEANASDSSSSSNESNPVTEIRFVPEDKGTCKY